LPPESGEIPKVGIGREVAGRDDFDQRPEIGQSGHWGSVPPTAAMGRSAVVDQEVGWNDRLELQATSGIDP